MIKKRPIPEPTGETYSIRQAHALIGERNITIQALYLAANRGEFPVIRIGRRTLIPRKAFDAYLRGELKTFLERQRSERPQLTYNTSTNEAMRAIRDIRSIWG